MNANIYIYVNIEICMYIYKYIFINNSQESIGLLSLSVWHPKKVAPGPTLSGTEVSLRFCPSTAANQRQQTPNIFTKRSDQ